uniref:SMP-30/Gluconolactonase/LRE-like region domain-containing protein n=1 Tax=Mycena chlorophos TaxID=658473 RepID=A0ABQ0L5F0_MYCCL|nr:predicted protein [Mycena chlorophos]
MHLHRLFQTAALIAPALASFPTRLLYESQTGLFQENIVVRASGDLVLTSVESPTLHTLNPHHPHTSYAAVYTFPNANGLSGIAEYAPEKFAVVASILNVTARTGQLGSVVVWSVDLSGPEPAAKPMGYVSNSTLINGLGLIPGLPDVVLAADSALGAVYTVNMRTGEVLLPIVDTSVLGPSPNGGTIGIDGLHMGGKFLYATNTALGTFLRIPLAIHLHNSSISPAGPWEILGTLQDGPPTPAHCYDDFTIGEDGRVWVATHPGELAVYTPLENGTWIQELAAGDPDGYTVFTEPTSAAFARDGKSLYVTTGGGQIVVVDTAA